jgi:outer membrane protein assembly factor BamB
MRALDISRRLAVASAFLLAPLVARGADLTWPQFRGPDSNPVGRHAKLPDRWSKTENVEWVAPIPGRGWSSPIVVGRKVFLTTVTTEGASKAPQTGVDFSNDYVAELLKQGVKEEELVARLRARDIEMPEEVVLHYFLYCLDLETGAVSWKQEFHSGRPPGGRHRKNSFASETPVSDGQRVYVYAGNLGLYAFDLDGKRIWSTPLEALPIYLDFGTGGSPALHGQHLFILNDNEKQQFVAAFDKETGQLVWRTPRDLKVKSDPPRSSGWTTPYVWAHPLRTEIVTTGPSAAVSYDLAGKELWRLAGTSLAPVASPYAYDGLLYVNGGKGQSLFAVKPGASGDITPGGGAQSGPYVAWSQERAGSYLPTQVAYDGALYVLSEKGILSRFDARTGEMTYKERIAPEANAFTSSPWAYNGKIFCLSEEGQTYVLAAGRKMELLHVNTLDEMAQATPALVGDRLLLRTEGRLYSIRRKPAESAQRPLEQTGAEMNACSSLVQARPLGWRPLALDIQIVPSGVTEQPMAGGPTPLNDVQPIVCGGSRHPLATSTGSSRTG